MSHRPHYSRPSRHRPASQVLHCLRDLDKRYAEMTRQAPGPLSVAEINHHYAKPHTEATHPVSGDPSPEDDTP